MAKYALVVVRPQSKIIKNIGDYIQTIATSLHHTSNEYIYIDREKLCSYKSIDKETVKSIINGCYVWNTQNWPPSENIDPLFISMHIFPKAEKDLFKDENLSYWKSHAPIGCRDLGTLSMFERRGIPAYFSACITLTLGDKYGYNGNRNGIYFVDPYIPLPLFKNQSSWKKIQFAEIPTMIRDFRKNWKMVKCLVKNDYFEQYGPDWGHSHYKGIKRLFMKYYHASQFYKVYSNKFTDNCLLQSEYITHMYRLLQDHKETDADLCKVAETFINKYAKAKMVVTSRIHAALPCLGLNTPVIFILNSNMESTSVKFNTPGRFGGIVDLFRTIRVEEENLSCVDEQLNKINKIDTDTIFENKREHEKYANLIREKVKAFINKE